jgi:hypothetical protein
MDNKNGKQAQVWQMHQDGMSHSDIARALDIQYKTVGTHLRRARKKADKAKRAPIDNLHNHVSPLTTVHYKHDPETGGYIVANEWRRQVPQFDAITKVVEELAGQVEGQARVKKRKAKKTDSANMLFELDIYDPHVGMYAAERQTLESDYDCDIAARRMVDAAEALASRSNRPSKVVIVFGGDVMHMDTRDFRTSSTASNHVLDVDTRYQRVVNYVVSASTEVVEIAAAIGAEVEIVITPGNHDWHACVWLTSVLSAYYSRCKHISVCTQQSPRKALQWGDNMLVWTHGDKIAPAKWPTIIAAEFAPLWGQTKYRYLKMGHVHHKKTIAPVVVNEQAGLCVEYLSALCPSDQWHADSGFVGTQRGASAFEYHKQHGLQTRFYHNF